MAARVNNGTIAIRVSCQVSDIVFFLDNSTKTAYW